MAHRKPSSKSVNLSKQALEDACRKRGLSRENLAVKARVSLRTVQRAFDGDPVSIDSQRRLEQALETQLSVQAIAAQQVAGPTVLAVLRSNLHFSDQEDREALADKVLGTILSQFFIRHSLHKVDVQDGSTEIIIKLAVSDALRLLAAYLDGDFAQLDIHEYQVTHVAKSTIEQVTSRFPIFPPWNSGHQDFNNEAGG